MRLETEHFTIGAAELTAPPPKGLLSKSVVGEAPLGPPAQRANTSKTPRGGHSPACRGVVLGAIFGRPVNKAIAALAAIGIGFGMAPTHAAVVADGQVVSIASTTTGKRESLSDSALMASAFAKVAAIDNVLGGPTYVMPGTNAGLGHLERWDDQPARPSNAMIDAALQALWPAIDAGAKDPGALAEALAMRASVLLLAESFPARGQAPYPTDLGLRRQADADLARALKLLPKLTAASKRVVASRIGEAIARDFVVSGDELRLANATLGATADGKHLDALLVTQLFNRIHVPEGRSDLTAYALATHARIRGILDEAAQDPSGAAQKLTNLGIELDATGKRGGDRSPIADQFQLLILNGHHLFAGLLQELVVQGSRLVDDGETLRVSRRLMANGDLEHLAKYTVVPDRVLWRLSPEQPESAVSVAQLYLAGFDNPVRPLAFHQMAFNRGMEVLTQHDPEAVRPYVDRFLRQVADEVRQQPTKSGDYRWVLERWISLEGAAIPDEARLRMRAFVESLPKSE